MPQLHKINKVYRENIRKARLGTIRLPETIEKMLKVFKGKTWEEIYGVEGAMKRRDEASKRRLERKNGVS